VETTSPRNSQLKLIEADERWGGHNSCPGVFLSKHRIDSLSCATAHKG